MGKKRELICGIVAVVILFTGWFALSQLRNQDTEYLENIFNSSSEIENSEEKPNDGEEPEDPEGSDDFAFNSSYNIEDFFYAGKNFSRNEIQLPMYLYQPYMYVAFNFDNFNYSLFRIGNHHSYGLKTLFPVFALTNTKNMIPNEDVFPEYTYLQYYTTFPFIYPYYYDFGIVGVVVLMALVGFVCAYMKRISDENIVGHIVYSLLKYAIIFSFFTNFLANATIWFYFAVLFAIYLVTTKRFTISFQKNRPSNKEQVM